MLMTPTRSIALTHCDCSATAVPLGSASPSMASRSSFRRRSPSNLTAGSTSTSTMLTRSGTSMDGGSQSRSTGAPRPGCGWYVVARGVAKSVTDRQFVVVPSVMSGHRVGQTVADNWFAGVPAS